MLTIWLVGMVAPASALGFTLTVEEGDGTPVTDYRWLLEEDNTHPVTPGVPDPTSLSFSIHARHAPVVGAGDSSPASLAELDALMEPGTRYFISVLPDVDHTVGGTPVVGGDATATIFVNSFPVPSAQIRAFVYEDTVALSGVPELPAERGLEGFLIHVADIAGDQAFDVFGNPLCTTYVELPSGGFMEDGDGNPVVDTPGTGCFTDASGDVVITNLAPGAYSVLATPPDGTASGWIRTPIPGGGVQAPVIVRAGEPATFEQGGLFNFHAFFGFVQLFRDLATDAGGGTITGTCVRAVPSRPPDAVTFVGDPIPDCIVGLNTVEAGLEEAVVILEAASDGTFTFDDVPPGSYQVAAFNRSLSTVIEIRTIIIGAGETVAMGDMTMLGWFSDFNGYVFLDDDEDGIRDPSEPGIPLQAINIRAGDGTIVQAGETDATGFYSFPQFPFAGHWGIAEVDFASKKATGATFSSDQGGDAAGPDEHTELGVVLTEAVLAQVDQENRADWGKAVYGCGADLVCDTADDENGGIAGIAYINTTRAEDDPRFGAGEEWEPGIPRLQSILYSDADGDGVIDDIDGSGSVELADIDNFPFDWSGGGSMGPEDLNRDGGAGFDAGDAIWIMWTDSFDDNLPTGCTYPGGMLPTYNGSPIEDCAEAPVTASSQRPELFDGGIAFGEYVPAGVDSGDPEEPLIAGTYIVEAIAPPGYEHWKEEDRNVDFGNEIDPTPALLPPPCVGLIREVPEFMSLDGESPAPFAGDFRPLCDLKQVTLAPRQNAVVDFHFFTMVPKAGRLVGSVLNILAPELDPENPNFGLSQQPAFMPVSLLDYAGNLLQTVYTDEGGKFNALAHSTFSAQIPAPSGVSPGVVLVCPNHPPTDPFHDPAFDSVCLPADVLPGKTTYVLAPVGAKAAVVASDSPVDCELPDGTPIIAEVNGGGALGDGPVAEVGDSIVITSLDDGSGVEVPNWDPSGPATLTRDYTFGTGGTVTVGGMALTTVSWGASSITGTVPVGASTGQLVITRADTGQSTVASVTVHVGVAAGDIVRVPDDYTTIQDAVDAAVADQLVLVAPGTYPENVIISKPLRLQGYGPWSTIIDASTYIADVDKRAAWQVRLDALISGGTVDTVPGQRLDFAQEDGAGITVLAKDGDFTDSPRALIDGLAVSGAQDGGGILVNAYARYLEISNNRLVSNHGQFGGGVRVGWINLVNDTLTGYHSAGNEDMLIHNNHFNRNGSLVDGGGIALYNGTDRYSVTENYICGGYAAFNGAGMSHFGLSPDGYIAHNTLLLNESFGEGAISVVGEFAPNGGPPGLLTPGTGSVTIYSNRIHANLAGDDGGGISLFSGSGQDVQANPDDPGQWYRFRIYNNEIVRNIAVFSGGGIATADTENIEIVNNTIAENDCVSLAAVFNTGDPNVSTPQGAGVVVRPHGPELAVLSGRTAADPLLVNNIIWHNRAYFRDTSLNGGEGGLVLDTPAYWDLQLFGQAPGLGEGLNPINCILSETYAAGPLEDPRDSSIVYDSSNIAADITSDLVMPVMNDLTIGPNPIAPTFAPRTLSGDYHLVAAATVAPDEGDSGALANGAKLAKDFDGESRPMGAGVDIGFDEIEGSWGECTIGAAPCASDCPGGGTNCCGAGEGTCDDMTGPVIRSLVATPNPTAGAIAVVIDAIAYDTGTGGSDITDAEIKVDGGSPFGMSPSDTFDSDEEGITVSIPPEATDFTVSVRAKDAAGNWGPWASLEIAVTMTSAGDDTGPIVDNLVATPNPTQGAAAVDIDAVAYDTLTGGSTVVAAEYWITIAPPIDAIPGTGEPIAVSAPFEVSETLTASIPVPIVASEYFIVVRAMDSAGNWGDSTMVFVEVTESGSGSGGGVYVQCPGDGDGDAIVDDAVNPHVGDSGAYSFPGDARCQHVSAGDGFVNMADGKRLYIFGFDDLNGVAPDEVLTAGTLAATFPAPNIAVDENDEFYLNVTNVGMMIRPDLFDPHTIHWHGFPNASAIFDGVPDNSVSINTGSTLTYYYKVVEAGTFMWHCHVEATEHMQMGMLGSLWVRPAQNRLPDNHCFDTGAVEDAGACSGHQHSNPDWDSDRNLDDPLVGDKYAYNDGDGSTYYDVEFPVQIGAFDPVFHDASESVQPLPFALMKDTYPMLNGRGYPDTIDPDVLFNTADDPRPSQRIHTRIEARVGQKVLLRIANLNVTRFDTLATLGIPMRVVGADARLLRGPSPDGGITPGKNLYYETNSVTLGGGQSYDVILETASVSPGTYFLYTPNLNNLNNNEEQFGGMMTEIIITP